MNDPLESSYRVLVVDDNEGIHHDMRALLGPADTGTELDLLAAEFFGSDEPGRAAVRPRLPRFELDSAFQGQAALERVQAAHAAGAPYALAFVDMRMPPGWDGVTTIRHLWDIDPDLQVIICSAYSDHTWEEIVEALGMSDRLLVLRKPFDPNALKQMTLAAIRHWRKERALRRALDRMMHALDALDRGELGARERALLEQARGQGELARALVDSAAARTVH